MNPNIAEVMISLLFTVFHPLSFLLNEISNPSWISLSSVAVGEAGGFSN